ncbi:MAG: hypothetical protein AAGJ95_08595 [Cyanobacteria bacterium J06554_11]
MYSSASFSDAAYSGESYYQLEGFTTPTATYVDEVDTLTMTDVYAETTAPSQGSWKDVLVTLTLMFGLVGASSIALGLAANQATIITQQLARYATQQALENVQAPISWRF